MRYNKIREMDISNGKGVRVSLFVQGCEFHCEGCFNPETWDFSKGKIFTTEDMNNIIKLAKKDYIKGLSILGGEPLHPNNIESVAMIAEYFKYVYPTKDIWLWTGYKYEDIIKRTDTHNVLDYIDVLVDGQFKKDKKNLKLKWAGSENQRCIDVGRSLRENKIVLEEKML